jgi:uncharacterized protein affecting Mg2+/Co2+ transport
MKKSMKLAWLMAMAWGFKPMAEKVKRIREKAVIGELVKVCPGKRHAWYSSNVGLIRKPYGVSI